MPGEKRRCRRIEQGISTAKNCKSRPSVPLVGRKLGRLHIDKIRNAPATKRVELETRSRLARSQDAVAELIQGVDMIPNPTNNVAIEGGATLAKAS